MAKIIKRVPFQIVEIPYESISCSQCGCGRSISENGVDNEWAEETRSAIGMKCNKYYENSDCDGVMELDKGNYINKQPAYTVIECDCGEELECHNFTNTCKCGKDYNFAGQQLASRDQWGEETGEHWSECY